MLSGIEIENFRCFESLKIENFKRINLIGGMNNSGKTALLEAIFLYLNQDVERVLKGRRVSKDHIRLAPDNIFPDFFYNRKTEKRIILSGLIKNERIPIHVFSNNESASNPGLGFESNYTDPLYDHEEWDHEDLPETKSINLLSTFFDASAEELKTISNISFDLSTTLAAAIKPAYLLLPSERKPSQQLASDYDQCLLNDQSDHILEFIQQIDPEISDIRSLSIGVPKIYFKKQDGQMLALNMYGDAVNRVMEIVLTISNHRGSTLLIDEVENGIHYTKQAEFWRLLHKLAETFDVQIFATTHSREMMTAFSQTFGSDGDAAYFELARKAKTQRIVAIHHDLKTLTFELERGDECSPPHLGQ